MNRSEIQPTSDTPQVILDPEGLIEMKGRLIARDPLKIFNIINGWLEEYFSGPCSGISISFQLEYINSAGTKSLLDMVKDVKSKCKERNVTIKWCYEEPDEDIFEKGSFISSITGMQFEFHEI